MNREKQMWEAVGQEHGELTQRELFVTLTAMEWADANLYIDWKQVRIQAAIAAMQGLLACSETRGTYESFARDSVEYADALVKELKGE